MAELIDKQVILDAIDAFYKCSGRTAGLNAEYIEGKEYAYNKVKDMLKSIPPALSVQKVIKCKDCKHRDPENKKCDCGMWHIPFTTKDDDFCSYAEAKMEEGE